MPRIKIDLPETFLFETEIDVRITDINYGGHLGNDVFLSLVHEARLRFLKHYGFTEIDVDGVSIIMGDAAVIYKAEVFYGDTLVIKVSADDLSRMSCDLKYQLLDKKTGREVARAKTGIVFYDYDKKQIADMPEKFRTIFSVQNKLFTIEQRIGKQ